MSEPRIRGSQRQGDCTLQARNPRLWYRRRAGVLSPSTRSARWPWRDAATTPMAPFTNARASPCRRWSRAANSSMTNGQSGASGQGARRTTWIAAARRSPFVTATRDASGQSSPYAPRTRPRCRQRRPRGRRRQLWDRTPQSRGVRGPGYRRASTIGGHSQAGPSVFEGWRGY